MSDYREYEMYFECTDLRTKVCLSYSDFLSWTLGVGAGVKCFTTLFFIFTLKIKTLNFLYISNKPAVVQPDIFMNSARFVIAFNLFFSLLLYSRRRSRRQWFVTVSVTAEAEKPNVLLQDLSQSYQMAFGGKTENICLRRAPWLCCDRLNHSRMFVKGASRRID